MDKVFEMIKREHKRQQQTCQLIASENFTSREVLAAQGSILTNKYAEGFPGRRYYGGCEDVDQIEQLAIDRAKELFGAGFANVQPHSGSSANFAVFSGLLKPGDQILGMSLDAGGHLTHGHRVNFSGQFYQAAYYGVNAQGIIDYDQVRQMALELKPRMIIAGGSAYSQVYQWDIFAEIAKECGALLMADMAHVSGLVAAGVYPSPLPHADVVTSTTHKTLRGPRGGMILGRSNQEIEKKINRAVFPGVQGGPLMHAIAAKAICYLEAMDSDFKQYQIQVIQNAKVMAETLEKHGFEIVSGEPQCHLFLLSLVGKSLNGSQAQELLESAGIIVNKNSIPNDPLPPSQTSGIRIGTPAMTTRGLDEKGAALLAGLIGRLLNDTTQLQQVKREVAALTKILSPVATLETV